MDTELSYLKPQLVLTLFGAAMIGIAALGFIVESPYLSKTETELMPSKLRVQPATSQPRSVIDQLQGAGGLQKQDSQSLQKPVSEQLQPNAKTDNLNSSQTAQ